MAEKSDQILTGFKLYPFLNNIFFEAVKKCTTLLPKNNAVH